MPDAATAATAATAGTSGPPGLLCLRDIRKTFGPVVALKGMRLDVCPGRVHALLGENGAGKSTLMKILAGVYAPTSGSMVLDGRPYAPKNPGDALSRGVSIVFQELSLCNHLSVADNIFAAHEPSRWGFVRQGALRARAQALLERLGLPVDVDARVARLSMGQRQLVEIAKGLHHNARVVILDEPTSSLSDAEAGRLFAIIDALRAQGTAMVYISHRMEEIVRLADDITVLRDGEYVRSVRRGQASVPELIAWMVGRKLESLYPPKLPQTLPQGEQAASSAAPLLEVERLGSPGKFTDITFALQAGEILGFFGLIGSGRSDVMQALFGMLGCTGAMRLCGRPFRPAGARDAIAAGIGFVTENRKEEGLVLGAGVRQNITMASLPDFSGAGGFLRAGQERAAAAAVVAELAIRTHSTETLAGTLSGGNQQKIVLAKWLLRQPRLLILDEPTRGVDVGARREIYRIIRHLAARGVGIVLVSSDLPEVLGLADRVLVMREKRVAAILPADRLSAETVMAHATGAGRAADPEPGREADREGPRPENRQGVPA